MAIIRFIRPLYAGAAGILALTGLLIFLPPDGEVRSDLGQFFGNLHPLAVHLPIALLLLVPVLEICGRLDKYRYLHTAAGFVLNLAAIATIVAPFLGWLLARTGGYEGGFVTQHMWGGVSLAAAALLCTELRRRAYPASTTSNLGSGALQLQPRQWQQAYAAVLSGALVLMAWTGYRGGQLAHGEDHLTAHLYAALSDSAARTSAGDTSTFYGARIQPIFDKHCVLCHSANKRKGGLRLDSYEMVMRGGKDGVAIKAGDTHSSDLLRRITLPSSSEDFMPAEGKPPLQEDEIKLIELWIADGASSKVAVNAIAGAPKMAAPAEPWAPDYRADQATIDSLAASLGIRLTARSQNPTDGLMLRTVSYPEKCDDALLQKLAPVAQYIVDAELARTKITDAGLKTLGSFVNLRALDLSHTTVSSNGLSALPQLAKLETLNLTSTSVEDLAIAELRKRPALKKIYFYNSPAEKSAVTQSTAPSVAP